MPAIEKSYRPLGVFGATATLASTELAAAAAASSRPFRGDTASGSAACAVHAIESGDVLAFWIANLNEADAPGASVSSAGAGGMIVDALYDGNFAEPDAYDGGASVGALAQYRFGIALTETASRIGLEASNAIQLRDHGASPNRTDWTYAASAAAPG